MYDEPFWNDLYASREQLWSGAPNSVLVAEVSELVPGRALDLGCGEGADAYWLADRGWRVTAVDISRLALERAAKLASDASRAYDIQWTHADLVGTPPDAGAYDLVSAQYFMFPHQDDAMLRHVLDAVAPGGTLLIVGHEHEHEGAGDGLSHDHDDEHHPDPADYHSPHEIAELLDDGWTIVVDETRPRTTAPPEGTEHTHDTVLRAVRKQDQ